MGTAKPRHWLATAMIGMTAQAVFPDMRQEPGTQTRERTDHEERKAAAATKRERKRIKQAYAACRRGEHTRRD